MVSMELKDYLGIIPEQYTGKDFLTTSASFKNVAQSAVSYNEAKK